MPRKKSENTCPASNTMLVLALLEGGDKYGYQIIRELECRSDQTFSMKEGTLYPILHGLEERGDVRSYERESDAGRCRREWAVFCKQFGKVVGGEACVPG